MGLTWVLVNAMAQQDVLYPHRVFQSMVSRSWRWGCGMRYRYYIIQRRVHAFIITLKSMPLLCMIQHSFSLCLDIIIEAFVTHPRVIILKGSLDVLRNKIILSRGYMWFEKISTKCGLFRNKCKTIRQQVYLKIIILVWTRGYRTSPAFVQAIAPWFMPWREGEKDISLSGWAQVNSVYNPWSRLAYLRIRITHDEFLSRTLELSDRLFKEEENEILHNFAKAVIKGKTISCLYTPFNELDTDESHNFSC